MEAARQIETRTALVVGYGEATASVCMTSLGRLLCEAQVIETWSMTGRAAEPQPCEGRASEIAIMTLMLNVSVSASTIATKSTAFSCDHGAAWPTARETALGQQVCRAAAKRSLCRNAGVVGFEGEGTANMTCRGCRFFVRLVSENGRANVTGSANGTPSMMNPNGSYVAREARPISSRIVHDQWPDAAYVSVISSASMTTQCRKNSSTQTRNPNGRREERGAPASACFADVHASLL